MNLEKKPAFGRVLALASYRRFFIGLLISLVGRYVQVVAVGWLAYSVTKSAFWLGIVVFCTQAPMLILTPFAGALVDRVDRKLALLIAQGLTLLQAALLAWFAASAIPSIGLLLTLSFFGGCISALDGPARQAFAVELAPDNELIPSIMTLNSLAFNAMRFVAPLLGGIGLASFGAMGCFLTNVAASMFFIGVLKVFKYPCNELKKQGKANLILDFSEGVRYALREGVLRRAIFLMAAMSFSVGGAITMLPAMANSGTVYFGIAELGFFAGLVGAGNLIGTFHLLFFASKNLDMTRKWGVVSCGLGSMFLVAGVPGFMFAALIFIGYGLVLINISLSSVTQMAVGDAFRGRVMALYFSVLFGFEALGGIFAGLLYGFDPVLPFLFSAAICLVLFSPPTGSKKS